MVVRNSLFFLLVLLVLLVGTSCTPKSGKKVSKLVTSEISKLKDISDTDKDSLYAIVMSMDSLHNQMLREYANFINEYLSVDSTYGVDSAKIYTIAQTFINKRNSTIALFVDQRVKMRKFIDEEHWENFSFRKDKSKEKK